MTAEAKNRPKAVDFFHTLVDDPLKTSHPIIEELRRWYGIIGDDFLACKYQEKATAVRSSLPPTTPTKEISVLKCPE